MAYATLPRVRARAGRLASAWDETSSPGEAEIETFLDDVAAELDAALSLHNVDLPITDTTVLRALAGVNADGALILAIEGTWPGGRGNEETKAILDAARRRYEAAWSAIYSGKFVAVALAAEQASGESGVAEAHSLWTDERDYPTANELLSELAAGSIYQAPEFRRGDGF